MELIAEIFNRSDTGGVEMRLPDLFAQQALHRAYVKHAEVTVPSLAHWEKYWQENRQGIIQPKLLPVDIILPLAAGGQWN